MSLTDKFKKEKNKIQNLASPKEKFDYLWDYYKFHALIIVICCVLLGNFIYNKVTEKTCVLNGIFLNCYSDDVFFDSLIEDFAGNQAIDLSKKIIQFQTTLVYDAESLDLSSSYATQESITIQIAAGDLDFIIADSELLNNWDSQELFSTLLPLSGCQILHGVYPNAVENLSIGILRNAPNSETATLFTEYLLTQKSS